jgi:hypothetical protein
VSKFEIKIREFYILSDGEGDEVNLTMKTSFMVDFQTPPEKIGQMVIAATARSKTILERAPGSLRDMTNAEVEEYLTDEQAEADAETFDLDCWNDQPR